MKKPANIHARLLDALFDAPGGSVWKRVLESCPAAEVFAAGGCVRDFLLGRTAKPKDFDLFLGAEDVRRVMGNLALRGRLEYGPFGSPRWYPDPDSTFYCDVMPIGTFKNGLWRCDNIVDVLNQFDFTANAVAFDLRTGEFFNPQNGVRDIESHHMRAVRFDYPDEPIAVGIPLTRPEVVWFRILHYASALGFSIEPITLRWLKANRRYEADPARFESVFFALHSQWREALE